MRSFLPTVLSLLLLLAVKPCIANDDLNGYWKNDDRQTWIEIESNDLGVVRRNDERPEAEGSVFLKDLEMQPDGYWMGQVYAQRAGDFLEATIELINPERMSMTVKFGFMKRTIFWTRIETIPVQ